VYAALIVEYARAVVFFTVTGSDEGDEVNGSGSAGLEEDGTLEIEISFDNGNVAILKAARE
jgi:hypothetical protein